MHEQDLKCEILPSLGEVYRFATSLWSRYAMTPDVPSEVHISDLTPFLKELLSQPVLPPGMPYQQQKMLGMLISSMFKLSFIEVGKQKNLRRFGFEPCKLQNRSSASSTWNGTISWEHFVPLRHTSNSMGLMQWQAIISSFLRVYTCRPKLSKCGIIIIKSQS